MRPRTDLDFPTYPLATEEVVTAPHAEPDDGRRVRDQTIARTSQRSDARPAREPKSRLRELIELTKGFGFIKPAEDGPDVFVHISAVQKAGYTGLVEGARISHELVPTRNGKMSTENLRLS